MTVLVRASAGLIVWALSFSLLYALQGMGCAGGWHEMKLFGGTLLRWILVTAWLLPFLVALALVRLAWAAPSRFEKRLSLATALAGAFAILASGAPVVLTSTCA